MTAPREYSPRELSEEAQKLIKQGVTRPTVLDRLRKLAPFESEDMLKAYVRDAEEWAEQEAPKAAPEPFYPTPPDEVPQPEEQPKRKREKRIKPDSTQAVDSIVAEIILERVAGKPSPEPPALHELLDDIAERYTRFIHLSNEHQVTAVALFTPFTYVCSIADSAPYLAITSPEKRSGKTRLIEVMVSMVYRPLPAAGGTEAVFFRSIELAKPTLFIDEVDTIFKDRTGQYEAMRRMLNGGNRRRTRVLRMIGDGASMRPHGFLIFCPKVLAGIGDIPETIADRCIPIRLERAKRGDIKENFRMLPFEAATATLRADLERWAEAAREELTDIVSDRPKMPEELEGRAADIWEPLIALADLAGHGWSERARAAAVALNGEKDLIERGNSILLLTAMREMMLDGKPKLPTADLLRELVKRPEEPWAALWGKDVARADSGDPHALNGVGYSIAVMLREFGIRSKVLRIGGTTARGYALEDCLDVFSRYLPCDVVTSVTPVMGGTSSVTEGISEAGNGEIENGGPHNGSNRSNDVTEQNDLDFEADWLDTTKEGDE